MSELQLGLLGIGIAVVLGVFGFNKWQEGKFRRRSEASFASRDREDVLLRAGARAERDSAATSAPRSPPLPSEARVEHTLGDAEVRPAERTAPERPPSARLDPLIDYIVEIECPGPVAGEEIAHHARTLVDESLVKPVHWEGQHEAGEAWGAVDPAGRYRRLRVGLQLADRSGPVGEEDLLAFCASVHELALAIAAEAELPDHEEAVRRAQSLDRFAAEVDVQIGLSVIGSESHMFPGGKIRGLAEASGLAMGRDGRFHRLGDEGIELFALVNLEPMPFHPETIRTLQTRGVTALFDVPRVPPSDATFRRFLDFAHQLEQSLGGVLVDDNRKPLGQAALEAISKQLREIHRRMEAQGIPAGSPTALRLFS
jgi:hypothetical protein